MGMAKTTKSSPALLYRLAAVGCFATLMGLTVYRLPGAEQGPLVLFSAVGAGVIGWLFLALLGWLIYLLDAAARQELGRAGIAQAVARGYLLLIPFTLLALLAVSQFRWDAALPFSSAGIMTAGAAAGAELGQLEDRRPIHWALPTLAATGFATLWAVLCSLAGSLGR